MRPTVKFPAAGASESPVLIKDDHRIFVLTLGIYGAHKYYLGSPRLAARVVRRDKTGVEL